MTTATVTVTAPATPRIAGPALPGVRAWPVLLLALPAFVAIWSGWVGLGTLTGFGRIQPLPGTPLQGWELDTRITLPIGVETYAAYALHVWLSARADARAAAFAKWSAIGSLLLGAAGQVAYHLMTAAGYARAPWQITAAVSCLPVAILGMGAALAHLVHDATDRPEPAATGEQLDQATTPATVEPDAAPQPETPDLLPGNASEPARPPQRPRAVGSRSDTGRAVARLRAKHPQMPAAEIARRLRVTDRTVRRHLAGHRTTTDPTSNAGEQSSAAA